jgi:hypothetical protein
VRAALLHESLSGLPEVLHVTLGEPG